MPAKSVRKLTGNEAELLLKSLEVRFEKNKGRHVGLEWKRIKEKLQSHPEKLWSLNEMERTGGEPDVFGYDKVNDQYLFFDCSAESPSGRRSLCYDKEGLESRKEFKPDNSAVDMAAEMGIDLLTEEEYRRMQESGDFDTKTSSWLSTPPAIRKAGGAIFGDKRYGAVFIYHNGAQSYYAVRGFRGVLKV